MLPTPTALKQSTGAQLGCLGGLWDPPGVSLGTRRVQGGHPWHCPWGAEGAGAPGVLSFQGLCHFPAPKEVGAERAEPPWGSWMGPLWLSLGALQRHDGLTEWEETRSAAGSSQDGSGAGWGVWGCWEGEPQGSTWSFGGQRVSQSVCFSGGSGCELSAAAEARCFPAGSARRLLREGLRGLYYYLLSLRGGEKRRNLHCWELCLIGAQISSLPPPGRDGLPCARPAGSGSPVG